MRQPSARTSLFLASFATLFVEILLVRWIGTEVRVFAFFQNLALITCFLGFGLGCYQASSRRDASLSAVAIAALVVFVKLPVERWQAFLYDLSNLLAFSNDSVFWMSSRDLGLSPLALTLLSAAVVAVFLLLLVVAMMPLGQWVGHYLDTAPRPLEAYSANLIGSLAGIIVFALLAFWWMPPAGWFIVALLSTLLFRVPTRRQVVVTLACLAVVLLMLVRTSEPGAIWSPYQKVVPRQTAGADHYLEVNNSVYMAMNDMRPEGFRTPEEQSRLAASPFNSPLLFARKLDRVLIVGSGGGNDVAGALRAGARQVDAVEIDPAILTFGRRLHPEQPYASPRVRTIVNDARAVFRQSQDRYDVVIFGLLDSHTHVSGYSNMRIDNYVYTEEALREARRLLAPGGIMVLKFEVRKPWTWMGDRFHTMMTNVFGRAPITYRAPTVGRVTSATVFIASDDPAFWTRATTGTLAQLVATYPPQFKPGAEGMSAAINDDWPYVYQRFRSIPRTYVTVSVVLLILALLLIRGSFRPAESATWRFFFLGAGFLLMETQMVSRLALYFGTTWIVSSIVIAVILLVLVVANVVAESGRMPTLGVCYALLIASLAAVYLIPWAALPVTAVAAGVLLSAAYCVPLFFAGLIFAESFRREERKSAVFGANILGSVAGGLAQNLSFVFGMKALLVLAAVIYAAAALTPRRSAALLS
ncbi:MAG: methyltransferase domain-containing protein [Thermoanaerobaculia bacterium]